MSDGAILISNTGHRKTCCCSDCALAFLYPQQHSLRRIRMWLVFKKTIVDILLINIKKALKQEKISQIAIAGGVSANSELRQRLHELEKENFKVFIPKFEYCTDNAGMIAIAGYYKYLNGEFSNQQNTPNPRMKI